MTSTTPLGIFLHHGRGHGGIGGLLMGSASGVALGALLGALLGKSSVACRNRRRSLGAGVIDDDRGEVIYIYIYTLYSIV